MALGVRRINGDHPDLLSIRIFSWSSNGERLGGFACDSVLATVTATSRCLSADGRIDACATLFPPAAQVSLADYAATCPGLTW